MRRSENLTPITPDIFLRETSLPHDRVIIKYCYTPRFLITVNNAKLPPKLPLTGETVSCYKLMPLICIKLALLSMNCKLIVVSTQINYKLPQFLSQSHLHIFYPVRAVATYLQMCHISFSLKRKRDDSTPLFIVFQCRSIWCFTAGHCKIKIVTREEKLLSQFAFVF